jgi:transcriptional regulator with XRE-family HTH domain
VRKRGLTVPTKRRDGDVLRAAREALGWTQLELGTKMDLSGSFVCRRERSTYISEAERKMFEVGLGAAGGMLRWSCAVSAEDRSLAEREVAARPVRDGECLAEARASLGLSQTGLAAKMGVLPSQISRWESRRYLTAATRGRFSEVLRVKWLSRVRVSDRSLAEGNRQPPRHLVGRGCRPGRTCGTRKPGVAL